MSNPEVQGALIGVICLIMLPLVVSAMISGFTGCPDSFVYMNTETYQGCVPYESIKEK